MPRNVGPDLEELKRISVQSIDTEAGRVRGEHSTVVHGQSSIYQQKLEDCHGYLDASADPTPHPWVDAEARAQDVTPLEAAQNVVSAHERWRDVNVGIEEARIKGKRAVREAADAASVCLARRNAIEAIRLYHRSTT